MANPQPYQNQSATVVLYNLVQTVKHNWIPSYPFMSTLMIFYTLEFCELYGDFRIFQTPRQQLLHKFDS